MYNYVYKITNLIDGRIYIGVHSTNNLDDGYMGSCKRLSKDITLLGASNFSKEILQFFDDRKQALAKERELVNEKFVKRKDTYNTNLGGSCGTLGLVPVRDSTGNTFMVSKDDPRYLSGELKHVIKGIKYNFDEKELKRRSEQGKSNAFVRRVTNGLENKSVHYTELDEFLQNNPGWYRGQTQHWSEDSKFRASRTGKHIKRINDAKIKKERALEERKHKIKKPHYTGWKWITDGEHNRQIKKELVSEFLCNNPGYRLGFTFHLSEEGRNHIINAGHRAKGKTNITIDGKKTKVFTKDLPKYPNAIIGWETH